MVRQPKPVKKRVAKLNGSPPAAAALMTFAVSCVAFDTIIVRMISAEIHPLQIAFFRNLFSLVAIMPWMLRLQLGALTSARLPSHVARAAVKLGALICFFYAASMSPLATVTAIAFTSPLFVALGSVVILGEPFRFSRVLALVLGLIGVLVVIRPGIVPFDAGILMAVISAIGLGAVGLLMKYLSSREEAVTVVSLNLLLTVPAALLLALPVWTMPSPANLALMTVQGVLGGLSQLSVSRAMGMADASLLSPIEFLRLPLVVVLAWLLFQEVSDLWTLVGGAVIFSSSLILVFGEWRSRSMLKGSRR